MRTGKFKHIFTNFLFILASVCQSQTQDLNSSPYHNKYAFATSYAWKFQFPVTYSTGGVQDTNSQWRPVIRYSQEQIQLPNEYLIASNYPGSSVKNQQPGQTTFDNQGNYQIIQQQPNSFPTQSNTGGQQVQYTSIPTQQAHHQIIKPQISETLTPTTNQEQPIAIQVPLLNDKGQQIGWQFFPLLKQYQQSQQKPSAITPVNQYGQQSILVYPPQSITPDHSTQAHQFIPVSSQNQQLTKYIPSGQQQFLLPISDTQRQQFEQPYYSTIQEAIQPTIVDGRRQVTNVPSSQGCIGQQSGTNLCLQNSPVLYRNIANSDGSNNQIQDINKLLQTYQQNLLQTMMSHIQQTALQPQGSTPSDSSTPIAIASATIADNGSGASQLNSFTYTKA